MRKSLILMGILDDSDVDWMLQTGTKRLVPAGARIVTERESLEFLYIVLSGVFNVGVGRSENTVARLMAGDVVGEMSFVDSQLPSATVTAVQESWVLTLTRDDVRQRLSDDQGFAARFYRAMAVFLCLRLRDSNRGRSQDREEAQDEDEIPEDILDKTGIAGHRFNILQDRSRSVTTA